jgi:hypothetical protein
MDTPAVPGRGVIQRSSSAISAYDIRSPASIRRHTASAAVLANSCCIRCVTSASVSPPPKSRPRSTIARGARNDARLRAVVAHEVAGESGADERVGAPQVGGQRAGLVAREIAAG